MDVLMYVRCHSGCTSRWPLIDRQQRNVSNDEDDDNGAPTDTDYGGDCFYESLTGRWGSQTALSSYPCSQTHRQQADFFPD